MLKLLGIVQFNKVFKHSLLASCVATLSSLNSVCFSQNADPSNEEASPKEETVAPTKMVPTPKEPIAKAKGPVKHKVASVRHVGESNRGSFVVIDSGQIRGYVIGLEVCFYDDHGGETTCGTIERSSPRAAGIRIERNRLSLIRIGDRVWNKAWGPVPPKGSIDPNDQNDVNKMLRDEEMIPPVLDRRWFADYSFAPSLPMAVNTLKFDAASRASGNGTVWSAGAVQRLSPVGFVTGVEFPKSGDTMQEVFFGYQFLPQSPVVSDYDLTDGSQTVQSSVTGHFYRIGMQIGQTVIHAETSDLLIAGGIDLSYITHKFSASLSGGSTLASGKMQHYLLSAPISMWWEKHLGKLDFRTGIDVAIPMVLFGQKVTGSVDYNEDTAARKDMTAVTSAIDPRKSLGAAIRIGVGGKF